MRLCVTEDARTRASSPPATRNRAAEVGSVSSTQRWRRQGCGRTPLHKLPDPGRGWSGFPTRSPHGLSANSIPQRHRNPAGERQQENRLHAEDRKADRILGQSARDHLLVAIAAQPRHRMILGCVLVPVLVLKHQTHGLKPRMPRRSAPGNGEQQGENGTRAQHGTTDSYALRRPAQGAIGSRFTWSRAHRRRCARGQNDRSSNRLSAAQAAAAAWADYAHEPPSESDRRRANTWGGGVFSRRPRR